MLASTKSCLATFGLRKFVLALAHCTLDDHTSLSAITPLARGLSASSVLFLYLRYSSHKESGRLRSYSYRTEGEGREEPICEKKLQSWSQFVSTASGNCYRMTSLDFCVLKVAVIVESYEIVGRPWPSLRINSPNKSHQTSSDAISPQDAM